MNVTILGLNDLVGAGVEQGRAGRQAERRVCDGGEGARRISEPFWSTNPFFFYHSISDDGFSNVCTRNQKGVCKVQHRDGTGQDRE